MATSIVHVSLMAIYPQGENAQHRYLIIVFSGLYLHPPGPSGSWDDTPPVVNAYHLSVSPDDETPTFVLDGRFG
jgi:hypothetical protein